MCVQANADLTWPTRTPSRPSRPGTRTCFIYIICTRTTEPYRSFDTDRSIMRFTKYYTCYNMPSMCRIFYGGAYYTVCSVCFESIVSVPSVIRHRPVFNHSKSTAAQQIKTKSKNKHTPYIGHDIYIYMYDFTGDMTVKWVTPWLWVNHGYICRMFGHLVILVW